MKNDIQNQHIAINNLQEKELINIAQTIPKAPIPTDRNNFAFFGITSTGKFSLINCLMGLNLAEVGRGETTKKYMSLSFWIF